MHCGPQLSAGLAEFIEMTAGVGRVGLTPQDPLVDEAGEALGQDGLRDVQMHAEVVEVAHAVERVSDDQQYPALADRLERPRQCAVLLAIVAVRHSLQCSS